jgi:DNA-binding transcriptional regulator YiaG
MPTNPSVTEWDAERVKALREHLHQTQKLFSETMNVRQQTVSEWERGVFKPRGASLMMLEMIAKQGGFDG